MVKRIFNKLVNIAPILMVGVTFLTGILSRFDFYSGIYPYLGDTLGYSLLTDLIFVKYYFRTRFCNPTKIAVVGLISMNLITLLTINTEHYQSLSDIYVSGIVLILVGVYKLKRWN